MEQAKLSKIFLILISYVLVACASGTNYAPDAIPKSGEVGADIVLQEPKWTVTVESKDEEAGEEKWIEIKPTQSQRDDSNKIEEEGGNGQPQSTMAPVIETIVEISRINTCSPLASVPLEDLGLVVSAPYDPPVAGCDERHHGVDFAYYRKYGRETVAGEQVQAVFPGEVAAVIRDSFPYGNLVIIETRWGLLPIDFAKNRDIQPDESLYLLYAHLEWAAEIEQGEQIDSCKVIGAVGKSGNAGVAHLHLEARIGPAGSQFGRMAYYTVEASQEDRETYLRWRTSGLYQHFDPMQLFLDGVGE